MNFLSPSTAAYLFAFASAAVVLLQTALALGAPLGEYAMGGKIKGKFPPALRFTAVIQAGIIIGFAVVVLIEAGVVFANFQTSLGYSIWFVVALTGVSTLLNLITSSSKERLFGAPVTILLFASSLVVALK